jgi:hypothetical protein
MSRDTDEHFHPVEYDLDSDIDTLKLAVDMCREAERAETWKALATALAKALNVSGWTPQSGGTEALEEFKRLLRQESRNTVRPQP